MTACLRLKSALFSKIGSMHLGIAMVVMILAQVYSIAFYPPGPCRETSDCFSYLAMARGFSLGEFAAVSYPFNLRILAPWLASRFINPVIGFMTINTISWAVFTASVYGIVKRTNLSPVAFIALITTFLVHPLGVSLYWVVPYSVDPLWYALVSVVTWAFVSDRRVLMWIVIAIGLFAKESFLFLLFAILVSESLFVVFSFDRAKIPALMSLLVALMLIVAEPYLRVWEQLHLFPQKEPYKITSLMTIMWWLEASLRDNKRIIVWIASVLFVCGPFLALCIGRWSFPHSAAQKRVASFFLICAAAYICFGLLAGADMSRIVFNGNLFIICGCLMVARDRKIAETSILIALAVEILIGKTTILPRMPEYDYYTTKSLNHTITWAAIAFPACILIAYCASRNVGVALDTEDKSEIGP